MKDNTLDLHGIRHAEVDALVENFVLMNQTLLPLTIICGNSVKMIDLAKKTLDSIGCEWRMYRYGILTIGRIV